MNFSQRTQEIIESRKLSVDGYIFSNLDIENKEMENITMYPIEQGGKRLRPIFLSLVAETFGTKHEEVLPVASAIELIHTSTLVQDDLPAMDDDNLRRGSKTLHRQYSTPKAILSANILLSNAIRLCTKLNRDMSTKHQVIDRLNDAYESVNIGQMQDVKYESANSITESQYMNMISKKTAELYAISGEIGAIVAHQDSDIYHKLYDFGHNIGMAFQIMDDVIDIQGSNTGKDANSDIKQQKNTLPMIYAREAGYNVFSEDMSVDQIIDAIYSSGSIEYAQNRVKQFTTQSVDILDSIDSQNPEATNALREISLSLQNRSA